MNEYKDDVTSELCGEVKHLKSNHSANVMLQDADEKPARTLKHLDLLNKLCELNLMTLFPNCWLALRIFCTLPDTVAEAERSFSSLERIKNYLRSSIWQDPLPDSDTFAIELELGRR